MRPQIEVDDAERYRYDGECLACAEELGKPGLVEITQKQDEFIFRVRVCARAHARTPARLRTRPHACARARTPARARTHARMHTRVPAKGSGCCSRAAAHTLQPARARCAVLQVESTGALPAEAIVRQAVDNLLQRINVLQVELNRADQQAQAMESLLV